MEFGLWEFVASSVHSTYGTSRTCWARLQSWHSILRGARNRCKLAGGSPLIQMCLKMGDGTEMGPQFLAIFNFHLENVILNHLSYTRFSEFGNSGLPFQFLQDIFLWFSSRRLNLPNCSSTLHWPKAMPALPSPDLHSCHYCQIAKTSLTWFIRGPDISSSFWAKHLCWLTPGSWDSSGTLLCLGRFARQPLSVFGWPEPSFFTCHVISNRQFWIS